MIKNKIIAIVGLGGQTQSELIPALKQFDSTGGTWILCDINQSFIDEAIKILPSGVKYKSYNRYGDMFREYGDKIDAIIACLPHFLYVDIIERALDYGIPVFKEKPFATSYAQAKQFNNLSLRKSVPIYTVTKRQFYPSYNAALGVLSKQVIGQPYMYSARHFIPHGNLYQGWRSTLETAGGGVFLDMGYHLMDVLLRFFGDVSQINMHWSNVGKPERSYEVEDAASLHIWHPMGVHGVFQLAALSGPKEESIEIRGTLGRLVVTNKKLSVYKIDGTLVEENDFEADGVKMTAEAMKQFFSNDKNVKIENLAHNVRMMRIFDQAYRRMLHGK